MSLVANITVDVKPEDVKYNLSEGASVTRTLQNRLSDTVSVLDFGADPTGATPSGAAFQAAIDAVSGSLPGSLFGGELYIPAGNYNIDIPLKYTWWATSGELDNSVRRLTIRGDGSANTFLTYSGDSSQPCLTVDGGVVSQQDPHLRINIQGLRVQRANEARIGWGIYFRNIAIMSVRDLDAHWFDIGMVFHDVIQVHMQHCQLGANVNGMILGRLNWTYPNVYLLQHVMFGGQRELCIGIDSGANIKLDSCTFEGTGNNKSAAAQQYCIRYRGTTIEGGTGLTVQNGYFENNNVFSEINIESNDTLACTHTIEGNSFQRTSPTSYCTTHINFSANNPSGYQRMYLRGNRFRFAGGYTHAAGESSVIAQTAWSQVVDSGNLYEPQQPPTYPASAAVDGSFNKVVLTAVVDASSVTAAGYNCASVERTDTGTYRINLTHSLSSPAQVPIATTLFTPGRCIITAFDAGTVTVVVQDSAGNASNSISFALQSTGLRL